MILAGGKFRNNAKKARQFATIRKNDRGRGEMSAGGGQDGSKERGNAVKEIRERIGRIWKKKYNTEKAIFIMICRRN